MGGGSLEKSRGARSQINFGLTANAFDEEAVPQKALAARMRVKTAKIPVRLSVGKPGWDQSVVPDGFKTFPERPLLRTLSKYDAHKRADYNFRAEVLDNTERRMYVPACTSKFEYSERHILTPDQRAGAPPALSRFEYGIHPNLEGKVRWDESTTGDGGGDPYAATKARERRATAELDSAMRNSRRRGPPSGRVGLMTQYEAQLEEQRSVKMERRKLEAAGHTVAWTGRYNYTAPLSEADAREMSRSVPVRKVTTWSLGSI